LPTRSSWRSPLSRAPALLGYASPAYGVAAAALGAAFVWYAWKVLVMPESDRSMAAAKALFGYSLLYLFAIFAAYLGDAVVARVAAGA
jgi:protoheme IX farnesyltransferase